MDLDYIEGIPFKIPDDEKSFLEEDFWASFDLSYPGLENVSEAVKKEDYPLAAKHLVQYFHERKNVSYLVDYRGDSIKKINPDDSPYTYQCAIGFRGDSLKDYCLRVARRMMEHVYVMPGGRKEIDLGPSFETLIHFNFIEDMGKRHRSSLDMFVRGQFFEAYAVLFHEEPTEEVLASFREVIEMFWREYPLTIVDKSPGAGRFMFVEDRDVMSAGWLILSYIYLLYTELPYRAGDDIVYEILQRIWFLGIQFRRFDRDSYRAYNHHLWERGIVPYLLAILVPEIQHFRPMEAIGEKVIRQHLLSDFNEAGGYTEHSIAYWSGAALGEMIFKVVYVAQLNDKKLLDEESKQWLNKSFSALAYLAGPTPNYESIGDNGGPKINPILDVGVKLCRNEDCQNVLDCRLGKRTDCDTALDYANDEVGFAISKDSYGPHGNQLIISAKKDCGYTGHNHMDLLAMALAIEGELIYGEPYADVLYHNIKMNSNTRGYMYNMESHNTVMAYGRPIQPNSCYQNKWGVYRPDTKIQLHEVYPEGMVFRGGHDAYTFCRHVRHVLFARKGGLWIQDEVQRGNRQDEKHIQRWNLYPGVRVEKIDDHTLLLESGKVRMLWYWPEVAEIKVFKQDFLVEEGFVGPEGLGYTIDAYFEPKLNPVTGIAPNNAYLELVQLKIGRDEAAEEVVKRIREDREEHGFDLSIQSLKTLEAWIS